MDRTILFFVCGELTLPKLSLVRSYPSETCFFVLFCFVDRTGGQYNGREYAYEIHAAVSDDKVEYSHFESLHAIRSYPMFCDGFSSFCSLVVS